MKRTLTVIPLPSDRVCPWWLWPNVLSLDAPAVALVWQEVWATCCGVELSWLQRGVLSLGVWLAYCGDRLLDARRLRSETGSPRHEFARRHAQILCKVWLTGAAGMVWLGLQLEWREILCGAVLLAGVGGYFLLHHWKRTREAVGVCKEIMAGIVFAVGAVFFVVLQGKFSWAFTLGVGAWAGLCAMNCLLIAWWDRDRDAAMGQPSLARQWAGASNWLWLGSVMVMALAAGAWGLDARLGPATAALMLGALALGELARSPAGDGRRVLADAVLLTPLLFLA